MNSGWRFMSGDKAEYAAAAFDDSAWEAIQVDRIWEEQGHDPLDGYCWYRLRVTIPAALQGEGVSQGRPAHLPRQDQQLRPVVPQRAGVRHQRGRRAPDTPLDDAFTKAEMALWNVERVYVLPPDDPRIRWGEENVIAVRVFDQGGQGGLWSGDQEPAHGRARRLPAIDAGVQPFVATATGLAKRFTLTNTSAAHTLAGELTIQGAGKLTGAEVVKRSEPMLAGARRPRRSSCSLPALDESALVASRVRFADPARSATWREETPYILTPRPPAAPRINGPAIVGARPGRPFLSPSCRRRARGRCASPPPGCRPGSSSTPPPASSAGARRSAGRTRCRSRRPTSTGSATRRLDDRHRRRDRADPADGLELVELLGARGRRGEGAGERRALPRTRGSRTTAGRTSTSTTAGRSRATPRRRSATRTARSSPTRSSPT